MKKSKTHKEAHAMSNKIGMGDYYGTGIKQKMGKMRESYTPMDNPVSLKKLKKPPRSLA